MTPKKPKTDALIDVMCHTNFSDELLEMVLEALAENYQLGINEGMKIANGIPLIPDG